MKTLIHEYVHHLHHTKYLEQEDRSDRELIAESSAYVICNYMKIDTGDYSFGYIKSWQKEPEQIKKLGSKVNRISAEILDRLQNHMI